MVRSRSMSSVSAGNRLTSKSDPRTALTSRLAFSAAVTAVPHASRHGGAPVSRSHDHEAPPEENSTHAALNPATIPLGTALGHCSWPRRWRPDRPCVWPRRTPAAGGAGAGEQVRFRHADVRHAPGFTKVTVADKFTPEKGYGFESTEGLEAADRGGSKVQAPKDAYSASDLWRLPPHVRYYLRVHRGAARQRLPCQSARRRVLGLGGGQ